ncbi:MAG: hypothetical protein RR293_06690 [Bacteroidales bacterium]
MKSSERNGKIYGLAGSIIFHTVIIALLILMKINIPVQPQDNGGGILVIMGDIDGYQDNKQGSAESTPITTTENTQDAITQSTEKSITLESNTDKKKRSEQVAVERQAKVEAEEKNKIDNLVAGAFKGGESTTSNGKSEGSPNGNSESGAVSGNAGYGSYDLGGRGLRKGETLPRPEYDNSNDEGVIAVLITVNQEGRVIQAYTTPIGSNGTAYSNKTLRTRAVESARKALFGTTSSKSNQQGTITYRFRQK